MKKIIISGPSGSGKNTLVDMLIGENDSFVYSISHTTRSPRPGEVDGKDYHFVSEEQMKKMIISGDFVEWEFIHENFYGTSKKALQVENKYVILILDVDGAENLMEMDSDVISIFIDVDSINTLWKRLETRGDKDICLRIQNAEYERSRKDIFHHIIINDKLETAKEEFYKIIYDYL
jgi:guanylate kinase